MNTGLFPPFKRTGLLLHGILLTVFAVVSVWGFLNLSNANVGPMFVVYLLGGLIAFAPLPLLGYRAYALLRAEYILTRDGLELRWGLRNENIPLSDIEWVRPVENLSRPLKLPPISMPGAVLGLRRHPELGVIEFLASQTKGLLLVGTAKRVYAITPAEAAEFTQTFARAVELGSLTPVEPKSVYPSFVVTQAWASGLARYLWLAALFLNLGLFVWVSLLIPAYPHIALGLRPDRSPDTVPSVQLIILPLLSTFLALAGWGAGLYFFRWEKQRALSFIVWSSSVLAGLLFLIAVLFILSTPI